MSLWWRAAVNRWRRRLWHALLWRPLFGERSADGRALPHTRIAPSSCLEHPERLSLGDHVFIGHFNWLEASGGLRIDEGVQITHHVCITTHSTHRSVRLTGAAGAAWSGARPGDLRAPVQIGAYSFIGPFSLIEPGSVIGRGSLVCAYSQVRGRFPDFAVLAGQPAQVVGDTRDRDHRWLAAHPELRAVYEAWAGAPGQESG